MPNGNRVYVYLDLEDKERVQRYLKATYKGKMSELFRRCILEKVTAWEHHQEELKLRRTLPFQIAVAE